MKIILIVFFNCLLAVCFSQSANDYYKQAVQLRKENAYLTAIRLINQALQLDSMNAEYYSFKAKCLFELKEYYESFVVFSKGIEKNPKESLLYKDRGYILLTISEFNDAISDFTEAAKFATDDSTRKFAYTYRAIAKLSKRDFVSAYDDLMTAYQMDSTDVTVLINLGPVCDEIGRGDESWKYLLKASEIAPNAIGVLGNIGFKYQEMGQHEKAVEYYDKVLAIEPNEPLGFSNRSYNRYKLGDFKGAMEDINKSLSFYSDNSYAYRVRALIYIAMKDYDKACSDLNIALEKGFAISFGDEVNQLIKKYCRIN